MNREEMIRELGAATRGERLSALRKVAQLHRDGELPQPARKDVEYVNNHIHTHYSFSPYSPAGAAYVAWVNGLTTAGIMDHDSVAGAEEFLEAGEIIGIATTVGVECRCSLAGTPFEGRRVNNPDQKSVAYLAMHGIPRHSIEAVQRFITPYRDKRNLRNLAMTRRLNGILEPKGIQLDFYGDIAPISQSATGGSITERHILYALALKLMAQVGKGQVLLDFLTGELEVQVSGGAREKLLDADNPMYSYYLLGALKSGLVEKFYIDATDECPHILEFVRVAEEVGAISAYAYLGDVAGSVTGDKKDQTFEDAFLDELVAWLAASGFRALTYMPTRNTPRQLERIMALCERHGLFQISGEDINSPFQSFLCAALEEPGFQHLVDAAWALIGHEATAADHPGDGLFSPMSVKRYPALDERVRHFARVGRERRVR